MNHLVTGSGSGGGSGDGTANFCVHTKFARFHDDFGSLKCSVCKQAPQFGLFYQCVPDQGGRYADSEVLDLESEMRKYNIGQRLSGASAESYSTMMSDLTRYISAGAPKTEPIRLEELRMFHAAKAQFRRSSGPICNFKICQDCLPAYRGRAWPLPDDTVDGISAPSSRQGMEIEPRPDTPRVVPGMNFHPEFRFYQQIPPHLIDDRRSPSVTSTPSNTMEDYYFADFDGVGGQPSTGEEEGENTSNQIGTAVTPYDYDAHVNRIEHFEDPDAASPEEDEPKLKRCARITFPPRDEHGLIFSELRPRTPTPIPSPPGKMWETQYGGGVMSSDSTTSSRTRGRYYDHDTLKAMQELERKMDAIDDLDEDSREKRAGRRLGQGRFYID